MVQAGVFTEADGKDPIRLGNFLFCRGTPNAKAEALAYLKRSGNRPGKLNADSGGGGVVEGAVDAVAEFVQA
jgi:hypothetical protein